MHGAEDQNYCRPHFGFVQRSQKNHWAQERAHDAEAHLSVSTLERICGPRKDLHPEVIGGVWF